MKRHPQQETEIKFFVSDVQIPEKRLKAINAGLVSNRTHELNYRYDTPELKLTSQLQVLRLRQDRSAYLALKARRILPAKSAPARKLNLGSVISIPRINSYRHWDTR